MRDDDYAARLDADLLLRWQQGGVEEDRDLMRVKAWNEQGQGVRLDDHLWNTSRQRACRKLPRNPIDCQGMAPDCEAEALHKTRRAPYPFSNGFKFFAYYHKAWRSAFFRFCTERGQGYQHLFDKALSLLDADTADESPITPSERIAAGDMLTRLIDAEDSDLFCFLRHFERSLGPISRRHLRALLRCVAQESEVEPFCELDAAPEAFLPLEYTVASEVFDFVFLSDISRQRDEAQTRARCVMNLTEAALDLNNATRRQYDTRNAELRRSAQLFLFKQGRTTLDNCQENG